MITVRPERFTKVEYDHGQLVAHAEAALKRVFGPSADLDIEIEVDEDAATTRFAITAMEPVVVVDLDGGAVENLRDPRRFGGLAADITFTRIFLELYDRRLAVFGAPSLDEQPSQAQRMAWDVNLYGRVARLGLRLHKPRFLYNFRNRHGFTDKADAVFEQLWEAGDTTWRRIADLSDSARGEQAG